MNVKQLREAIKDLPDNMPVSAWTCGDTEFPVKIATIYHRKGSATKPCLFLGSDQNEFDKNNEIMLCADEIEDPDNEY